MIIENEMIHGCLARLASPRQQRFPTVRRVTRPDAQPKPLPPPRQPGMGEWDLGARSFAEEQRRCEEAGAPHGPPCRTRIEDDTPIVTRAAAERVCQEASLWLGERFPRGWATELAERANVVYQHNARFRRLLRKPGNAGRDWLYIFMRHWLSALLASRSPHLA